RQWVAQREQIDETEIVLFGRSLGGGVAVDLAAKDGARALILESTFTSLPEVANDLLPLSPGLLMLSRFDSINKIADYQEPLLIAHGTQDKLIPFAHGKRLFDAANEPKQLVPITGADHNWTPPPGYLQTLDAFLDKVPAKRERSQ
ncbi:MAG: alpha/beta hydrolase, partial [Lacipirellulaceae bacterium]